jgi:ubiquinone/menaquinone biosynthesis C-methylase UbiE
MLQWKQFWEDKGSSAVSDYEFDRGASPRPNEIETLSTQELLEFIGPKPGDVVVDAGCGTGVNMLLLHSKVERILGMDYSASAIARCKRQTAARKIPNVRLMHGDVTAVPLPDASADIVLCMSVLQYLSDAEVRTAFAEFARILRPHGTVILHVKNLSSLYLSTLWVAKRLLLRLGRQLKLEYFRPYRWYVNELTAGGFVVAHYNSFNLFMIESMPQRLLQLLQKLELRHHAKFPFRTAFMRRHGSELKIKACINKTG